MNNGIATDKNMLGADCLILGFFFFWYLLQTWRTERSTLETKRASADRRVSARYLVAFLTGAQCHICHIFVCRDIGGRVCRHPF